MKSKIEEEFISTLSHEIRTPLTSIKGFSQTMLSSWDVLDDVKKKDFLKIILNQSQRLINLVENVLNVAKLDSDCENIILAKNNLNQILTNCINIIKINNKDFEFNVEKKQKELFSLCDKDKVQQILLNILDNAVKYSVNSKKIDIKTMINNEFCLISVKNYGIFIDEKNKEKIFEKFYRVDSYIKTTTQGSGLGLYIVNNLIQKMNGKIEINSSKEEKFVEFLVFLPIYEVEKLTKNIGV